MVTLLSATRTHYNSLCCSRSVNHSKMPNATPGRCNVAAIFYYKDNLIHIVSEIPYKFCRDPVTLRVKSLLYVSMLNWYIFNRYIYTLLFKKIFVNLL